MSAHEKGIRAARALAQWELGDPRWANRILDAYRNPDTTMDNLRRDGALEDQPGTPAGALADLEGGS